MPVRLLVAEKQAEEAERILKNSDQLSPEEQVSTFPVEPAREERQEERGNKNSWEILGSGRYFSSPAFVYFFRPARPGCGAETQCCLSPFYTP
jgi:hypothetical protein